MTAPVRERLLTAITAAVDGVYKVPTPEDERDLPMTFVSDENDEATSNYTHTKLVMTVNISRFEFAESPGKDAMREQAHELMANIVHAMYDDPTFGGLAQKISVTGCGIGTGISRFVEGAARFDVSYQHILGDPRTVDIE